VRDYGGVADEVAALLPAILPAVDSGTAPTTDRSGTGGHVELTVITPTVTEGSAGEGPEGLAALLLSLGIPYSLGYLGMIKLIDPAGLLDALDIRDVAVESLGADSAYTERWRVRHGTTTLDLSEGELVKLLFGPERRPDVAPGVFPLTFWQWPFDRV
jgi:hypothetical protein